MASLDRLIAKAQAGGRTLDGRTLEEALDEQEPFSLEEVARMALARAKNRSIELEANEVLQALRKEGFVIERRSVQQRSEIVGLQQPTTTTHPRSD